MQPRGGVEGAGTGWGEGAGTGWGEGRGGPCRPNSKPKQGDVIAAAAGLTDSFRSAT